MSAKTFTVEVGVLYRTNSGNAASDRCAPATRAMTEPLAAATNRTSATVAILCRRSCRRAM